MADIDRLVADLNATGRDLRRNTERVLRRRVGDLVDRSRSNVRSQTGELARSIEGEVEGTEIRVGSPLPQARVVEEGGPRNEPQRYLERAFDALGDDVAEDVMDAVIEGVARG